MNMPKTTKLKRRPITAEGMMVGNARMIPLGEMLFRQRELSHRLIKVFLGYRSSPQNPALAKTKRLLANLEMRVAKQTNRG